mgnify:CR=1 FL=1|tara:strand:+ start:2235 stop:2423 length:189 start_codon:yes stop_codon:yes gene_type:complete
MQKKKGRPKKKEVNYLKGNPNKEENEVLKKPIKSLSDIPQELKPRKKKVGFWQWLFPKIWTT